MSRFGTLGANLYRGQVSYDFVGKRKIWYSISAIILIVAIGSLLFRGLNLGIEFKGGAEFLVPSSSATINQARDVAVKAGIADPIVTQLGTGALRVQTRPLSLAETNALRTGLGELASVPASDVDAQIVGPSWGADITSKALQALIVFLILVAIFLSVYFEWRMAVAALVALVHDVVITIGIYALTGFEVTPATVVGVLTILGYSLYDTVVVFDKVRENTRGIAGQSRVTYSEAANLALNQTLVRSINTTVVALLPVVSILIVGVWLLGAGTLKDLALALFIGLLAGAYSSLFIATPVLCQLKERDPAMQAVRARVEARNAGRMSGKGSGSLAVMEGDEGGPVDGQDVSGADLAAQVDSDVEAAVRGGGGRNQPKRTTKRKR
ncbi:MAG: protein translocase subunit SecF [Actinomycetes bacterium]